MFHANGRSKRFVSRVLGACVDNCDLLELRKSTPKIADYKVLRGQKVGRNMGEACLDGPAARRKSQIIDLLSHCKCALEGSTMRDT